MRYYTTVQLYTVDINTPKAYTPWIHVEGVLLCDTKQDIPWEEVLRFAKAYATRMGVSSCVFYPEDSSVLEGTSVWVFTAAFYVSGVRRSGPVAQYAAIRLDSDSPLVGFFDYDALAASCSHLLRSQCPCPDSRVRGAQMLSLCEEYRLPAGEIVEGEGSIDDVISVLQAQPLEQPERPSPSTSSMKDVLAGAPYVPQRILDRNFFGRSLETVSQTDLAKDLQDIENAHTELTSGAEQGADTRKRLAAWCSTCVYQNTDKYPKGPECQPGAVKRCSGPKTEDDLVRFLREHRELGAPPLPRELPGFTATQIATLMWRAGTIRDVKSGHGVSGPRRRPYVFGHFDRRHRSGEWGYFLFKETGDRTESIFFSSYAALEAAVCEPIGTLYTYPADIPDSIFEIYGYVVSNGPKRVSRTMHSDRQDPLQALVLQESYSRGARPTFRLDVHYTTKDRAYDDHCVHEDASPLKLARYALKWRVPGMPAATPAPALSVSKPRKPPIYLRVLREQEGVDG